MTAAEEKPAEPGGKVVELIRGNSLDGWTDQSGNPVTKGWKVEGGVLSRTERGGAIYPAGEFDDFILDFDWKIAPKGNSGVKYRVKFVEKGVRGKPHRIGCEYQIWDDAQKTKPETSAGSLYGLYAPGANKKVNPAGQWNHARIVSIGSRIEHWLNGEKIVEADTSSRDWRDRVSKSKFCEDEGVGQNTHGRIQIQDHGANVWFRNMTLQKIDPTR